MYFLIQNPLHFDINHDMIQKVSITLQFQTKGVADISRLAEIRKERGYSQAELSEKSGVSRVSIARYETGKVSPNARALKKLAGALRVKIDDLVDRKGA